MAVILTIVEVVWFLAIIALTLVSGEMNSGMGFIAAILGLFLHYLTNKGNPWIMNLYPFSAGFRMLIADMILCLVVMNMITGYSQNWLLLVITLVYIPFEYFAGD